MRLVYSEMAVADLTRLRAFIAEKNPTAAARIAADLVVRLEKLRLFPQMGIAVPQAPQPGVIREMEFGRYVVRYAAQAESVVVLRIWHHLEDREGGRRVNDNIGESRTPVARAERTFTSHTRKHFERALAGPR